MKEKDKEDFKRRIDALYQRGELEEKQEWVGQRAPGIGERRMPKWTSYDPVADMSDFDLGRNEAVDVSPEHWSVPWSDLMMTMFVMFAVLYSYLLTEKDVLGAFQPEVGTKMETTFLKPQKGLSFGEFELTPERLFEVSKLAVKEANLEDVNVVLEKDKTVRVSVRGPLLFDLGKAELREGTKNFLKKIALVLKKTKNEVHVAGHTDNFPVRSDLFQTNWELSVIRASGVARYLIEQGKLEPGRFSILGHSMYRPIVPNTTNKNKQKNRRVEIIITRDIYKGNSTR